MSAQLFASCLAGVFTCAGVAASQMPPTASSDLDSLIRVGLQVNPSIHAAEHNQAVARARIGPAGAWPDPVLGLGLTDLPIARPWFYDSFTRSSV